MDVLKRIDELRKERGWTYYRLADEAAITQSTIANMYARKSTPSISTLSQICDAFGITLSEFFNDGVNELSDEELWLVSNYRKLSSEDKKTVYILIKHFRNE